MGSLTEREPCPDCILGDVGMAFAIGAVRGSAFHFIKGLCNSPNGTPFAGGMEAMHMNVPRVGGSLAVWAGLFCACDCALVYMRQKEDPWNCILSGAATGGILSVC
ncbi:mitochondrial import inner membrane translocase subunit TIM17-2-like [Phragmites australis]|uniref:mitochondrial import inner membrane translocase subunit TIM17-2-like n=1 Tax=Phragmites australis TaxID=29695 RepID=UPI002D772D9D|nr:mitochondrial import inner membrane translocase subunit TIM17-2-like [Phragmites australis]